MELYVCGCASVRLYERGVVGNACHGGVARPWSARACCAHRFVASPASSSPAAALASFASRSAWNQSRTQEGGGGGEKTVSAEGAPNQPEIFPHPSKSPTCSSS